MPLTTIHQTDRPRVPAVTPPATAGTQDVLREPRRGWILATLCFAQLMISLDVLIVNIALPSAQRSLGFGIADRQWAVTAYTLAFGSLLLLGGRLSDLFGRKRMFVTGLIGFGVASAVGGAATSFVMLVIARAVQGAFGAVLAPAALALLTTTFTDGKGRARAFGIYAALAGGGAAVGLLLGGLLVQYLNWRWCMFVNVGFAATALLGATVLLRPDTGPTRPTLDVPGIALVSAGLFGLVFGLSHASTAGWSNHTTLGFIAAGAVVLVRLHLSSNASVEPGPAAARGARPQPRRGLPVDFHGRARPVRDVVVRHLLLPADTRVHRDPVGTRLPSLARRVHHHGPDRDPGDSRSASDPAGRSRPASHSQASRWSCSATSECPAATRPTCCRHSSSSAPESASPSRAR